MRNNGRTRVRGRLLPAHPQRKGGELLSSWIVRTARANAVKLHTFVQHALEGEEIWNRDIDKSASPKIVKMLAGLSGRPEAEVWKATLQGSYEGRLYPHHNPLGNTRWISPVGVYHRTRTRHGLLYCPLCLEEGEGPYFRKKWRLAVVSVCTEHEVRLLDRCPACSEPVAFHRADFEDRGRRSRKPLSYCSGCGSDLRAAQAARVERSLLLRFQRKMLSCIGRGWIEVPEYGKIRSHLWFDALYQLAKIIGLTKRGEKLRSKLQGLTGTETPSEGAKPPPQGGKGGAGIESVALQWRRHVLYLLAWLLEDWPNRFLEVSKGGALTYSIARIGAIGQLPYWYDDFCRRHLATPTYSPTEVEIMEAYRYLRRNGKRHTIHATSLLFGIKGGSKKVRRVLKENGKA